MICFNLLTHKVLDLFDCMYAYSFFFHLEFFNYKNISKKLMYKILFWKQISNLQRIVGQLSFGWFNHDWRPIAFDFLGNGGFGKKRDINEKGAKHGWHIKDFKKKKKHLGLQTLKITEIIQLKSFYFFLNISFGTNIYLNYFWLHKMNFFMCQWVP